MLPIVVLAAVVVPLLLLAFLVMRRSRAAGEPGSGESEAERLRIEQEFAEAEAYDEKWRSEQRGHRDDGLP